MSRLIDKIQMEISTNGGKLSPRFINEIAESGKCEYGKIHTTRVCVLKLPSGHELLGYAQVLDPKNDVEEIGNKIARDNAIEELWSLLGGIAKALME